MITKSLMNNRRSCKI